MNNLNPGKFRTLLIAMSIASFAVLPIRHVAAQAALPYGASISQAMAEKMTAAAVAHAREQKWRLAIAVVDTHGFLVHFTRMDDTQTAGPAIAVEKAKTAVMFRRASRVFEEGLSTRLAYLSLPGATAVTGGVPIILDGVIIGGIGASGASSDNDEQAAMAGLRALAK
jgi:glc operon protein GlcG